MPIALFEAYPVTESVLVWYPLFIVSAELTLNLIRRNVDDDTDCIVPAQAVWASTAFFLTVVSLETWHFMILYAMPPSSRNSAT